MIDLFEVPLFAAQKVPQTMASNTVASPGLALVRVRIANLGKHGP